MASESTPMASEVNSEVESKSSRRWLVMVAVGVGSLLGSLDSSVVNIALPTIRRSFGTDVATAEWVVSIYLLMACGFLLTFGRIGDLRGQKPVYVWGFRHVCRKFSLVRTGAQHRDADLIPCGAGARRRYDFFERGGDSYPAPSLRHSAEGCLACKSSWSTWAS